MKNILIALVIVLYIASPCFAKRIMKVKSISQVDTNQKKIEYSYIAQEKLRLLHNVKGKEFKDGIITEAEWKDWKINYFKPRQEAIMQQILEARKIFKKSTKYTVDLNADFTIITP